MMTRFRLAVAVVLATVFLVAGMAFSQGANAQAPGRQGPPRYGCQQRFHSLDANHDGKLTKEEFLAAPHWRNNPKEVFASRDVNGNGYLTKEEFCWGPGGRGMGGRGMGGRGMGGRGMGGGMWNGSGMGMNQ